MDTDVELSKGEGCETSPGCSGYSSMVHSKKVIKHALRQQAKRRRKNTTIAAGNSRTLPRIVVKPLPPPPPNDPPSPVNNAQHINAATEEPAATMREVLASLPGFSLKSGRRRSTKRLSATAQLEAGLVDLESPASILASTSLRALLNRHTFQGLPPLYQRKLAQLLPAVDRQDAATSGLNNEFFARACLEWRKRLAEGEFTPENQQRLKMEAERDKNKLDPWKVKHFEPIWGEKREPKLRSGLHCINESRSSGAVTRSSLRLRLESNADAPVSESIPCPIIMAEEKVEEESCKSEATMNRSDEQYEAGMQQGLHLEEEEEEQQQQQPQLTEKHETGQLEESEMNSVESLPEAEMQPVEEKVCQEENQDPEEEQTEMPCQPEAANSYQEEVRLAATENNLNTAVEEHILEVSEDAVIMEETSANPSEQSPTPAEAVPQLPECQQQQQQQSPEEQIPRISKAQISRIPEDQIYQISDCETTTILESSPSHDNAVRPPEIVMEDSSLITNGGQTEASQVTPVAQVGHENPADGESQIPEGMEIDSETLQRIHELEVRGEMREAYEEISGCPEEIIYPILDGIEMGAGSTEEPEGQVVVAGQPEAAREQQDVGNEVAGNEDEALRDANNYVCSEMLECSWSVDPSAVNNISNNTNSTAANSRSQEELQVPWPLVAAALDGSVAANITVTTQDECGEASAVATTTTTTTDAASSGGPQFVNQETSGTVEPVNCIQLPAVVQGTAAFQPDALIGPQAIMKNFQSQSPPIITFPQLQSIRFVQTSFHHADQPSPLNNGSPGVAAAQLQPQNSVGQVSVMRTQEELVQVNAQGNNLARPPGVVRTASVQQAQAQTQAQNPVPLGVQGQGRQIVIQHQASAPPARQVVASIQQQQQQQQYSGSRSSRSGGQGQRGSRSGNKEQGGRSRTTTKEPPGAVNLERSYQICQAVIQSSPNRDQLKAHLKPPPSLLARGDGAFTTSKSGGRTITTVKSQKPGGQTVQHATATKQPPSNKSQPVMLRHVFATARQATSAEVPESSSSSSNSSSSNGVGQQQQQQQLASTGTGTTGSGQTTGGLGQYILVQRTGVGDGAPRASSAPPLPPQIAGIGLGVGVHLVRGRPASAGEGSHQAVTLKPRGADGRGGGGAEPSAPGLIIGGDPPPPCECNMRGAMVICRQCGAFCHDDCIGPQRICATCLIR